MRQKHDRLKERFLWIAVVGLGALVLAVPAAFGANGASIAFNPSTFDFGTPPAGNTVDVVFVLTNSGKGATGALTINLTTVTGSGFTVLNDSCTNKKLAAGKNCSVTVRYTRPSATSSDSASLFAGSSKPALNATATLTGGLSEGCASVNNTAFFQGQYVNGGVNLPFKAGETVNATAGEPTIGTPTSVILYVGSAENVVNSTPYPGTAHYTIPTDGTYAIGWRTDAWQTGAAPTWALSCGS